MTGSASGRVLVVAGHDDSYRGPTGGAGVDADREAIEAAGGTAACVVTAWTEQRDGAVRAVRPRQPEEWAGEARAALREPIGACKSGLLPGAAHVRTLAWLVDELAASAPGVPVVVDPVLAASGGEVFLDDEGIEALLAELLPRGVVLTPNVPEAARLAGLAPDVLATSREARVEAAATLLERGARAVVLKGGHAADERAADLVLARDAAPAWVERPRRPGPGLHGSGCRFASRLALELARGATLPDAAQRAGAAVAALLAR